MRRLRAVLIRRKHARGADEFATARRDRDRQGPTLYAPSFRTMRAIFPIWALLSIRAWLAAASASGNVRWTSGRIETSSRRGQTCFFSNASNGALSDAPV